MPDKPLSERMRESKLNYSAAQWSDQVATLEQALAAAQAKYRCFHCGFETSDEKEAASHFGDRDDETPLCVDYAELNADGRLEMLQSTIRDIRELEAEREENAVQRSRIEGLEYQVDGIGAAVSSRFKNCTTIDEAWHAFDSMEGRALLAEEQRDQAIRERDALEKALQENVNDTIAWIERHLSTTLKYIPDSDQSGHPHGYSVIQIPDWEAKQKLDWLREVLRALEVKGRTCS